MTNLKIFHWATFCAAVIILPLNFGLGLIAMGLFTLPVLILHFIVALSLNRLHDRKALVILSGLNLFIFALVRPDGVHSFTDNGLSALLGIFGIHGGYSYKYENYFFYTSLVLLVLQVIIDLWLRKLSRE